MDEWLSLSRHDVKKQKQINENTFIFYCNPAFSASATAKDANSGRLEDCLNPDVITKALVKLHNTNWRELTLEQLWDIWPTELHYEECTPGGCKIVESQDRIINGVCQCCAVFLFDKQGTKEKQLTQGLGSIFIYYASAQQSELVDVAKMFANAFGIEEEDLKNIGQDPMQNFGWETTDEVGRITLNFEKSEHIWVLSLSLYGSQNIEK